MTASTSALYGLGTLAPVSDQPINLSSGLPTTVLPAAERAVADRLTEALAAPAAERRAAVAAVVAEGKVRTYDMMKMPGGPKAIEDGAATTIQVTDAIIGKLG